MKFLLGFVVAVALMVIGAIIFAATYNVAASARGSTLEFGILHSVMRNSVRARAGEDGRETWTEEELRKGFER